MALVPAEGVDEDELLDLAAAVEDASEHPIARAIRGPRPQAPRLRCRRRGVQEQRRPGSRSRRGRPQGRRRAP